MIRGCFAADDLAGFTSPGRRNFNGLFFLCYAGCFVLTRGVAGYSIFDFCRLVAFLFDRGTSWWLHVWAAMNTIKGRLLGLTGRYERPVEARTVGFCAFPRSREPFSSLTNVSSRLH